MPALSVRCRPPVSNGSQRAPVEGGSPGADVPGARSSAEGDGLMSFDFLADILDGTDPLAHQAARTLLEVLSDQGDHGNAEVLDVLVSSGLPEGRAIDLLGFGALHRPPIWRRWFTTGPEEGDRQWFYALPVRSRATETIPPTPEVANGEKSAQNGDEGVIRPIETQPVGGLTHKPAYPAVRVREVPPNPNAPKKRMRRTWRESRLAWSALSQAKQRAQETYGTDTPTT